MIIVNFSPNAAHKSTCVILIGHFGSVFPLMVRHKVFLFGFYPMTDHYVVLMYIRIYVRTYV